MSTRYVNRRIIENRINIKRSNHFGGFICYAKLVVQIWRQSLALSKTLSRSKAFAMFSIMSLKTPYWLFIKPFAAVFSIRRIYKGSYVLENNKLKEEKVKKTVILYFIGIPFFCYVSKLNESDWKYLLEK